MLFNSHLFILLFLPITVLLFYQGFKLGGRRLAIPWLVLASLFFYGYWNPPYLALLLLSMGMNFLLGRLLIHCHGKSYERFKKIVLLGGIALNLGLIGYYKYFNFFVDNFNQVVGSSFLLREILLPLGISFYTFQQIAYLIDSSEGETKGYQFIDYCLFVCFFPQLIAGPIVSHQEMMPQFSKPSGFRHDNLAIGLTIFFIGLFKKVVLADSISVYATPVFDAAESGVALGLWEAWFGALAYTIQIYFDFSGYSDMAIGAARLLGFRLPINFNSPYKALNIIDFWKRWHITLTRFLTRYLYNPMTLRASRRRMQQGKDLIRKGKGSFSAYLYLVAVPTIITMFLAGLWHGAGWTYIVFGLLHGLYLSINHGWHMLRRSMGHNLKQSRWWQRRLGHLLTFGCVIMAMTFFRATSVKSALAVLAAMAGFSGTNLSELSFQGASLASFAPNQLFDSPLKGLVMLVVLMLVAFSFPNTQEWMADYEPALGVTLAKGKQQSVSWLDRQWQRLAWKPSQTWALLTAGGALLAVLEISSVSEFIYFQF
jgi:alginate O-acetyltransferase complex protein AlgI